MGYMSTNEITPGSIVHLLRGTKYAGAWEISTVGPANADGFRAITSTDGASWFTRDQDAFATEGEARSAAKARRKPRQARTPQPLYGDFATVAMLNRISVDGTGRIVR